MEEEEKKLNSLINECNKLYKEIRDYRIESERIYNYTIKTYKKLIRKEKERNNLKRKIFNYY